MVMYPDDGGLREPVRPFENTFRPFEMLREHFASRATAMGSDARVLHIPGLYYSFHNLSCASGHKRLFGSPMKGRGWAFYHYGHQSQPITAWALHRRWNFVLFCIHHVGEGKSVDPKGWHITWAGIWLTKRAGEIALHWRKAETFRTYKVGSR